MKHLIDCTDDLVDAFENQQLSYSKLSDEEYLEDRVEGRGVDTPDSGFIQNATEQGGALGTT